MLTANGLLGHLVKWNLMAKNRVKPKVEFNVFSSFRH